MPLIALEILLAFGVVAWAGWDLVSLRREQRRDREKAAAEAARDALGPAGPADTAKPVHIDTPGAG